MTSSDEILARLNKLERSNHFLWRLLGGLALCLILAVSAGGAFVSEESLMLRDRDGRPRFVTGIHPEDVRNVYLTMADDNKRQFLRMGNDPVNGSYFFIEDNSAHVRLKLGVDRNNNAYMFFYDEQGKLIRRLP